MLSIFAKAEPYLFLAPALAILLVFLIFPLFWHIYISLNYVFHQIGLQPIGLLSDPNMVIWSLVIANMWYGTPFTMLFLTAGLLSINPTIYEAALIDGATKIRTFLHITLQLLKPFIVINLILITM